MKGPAASAGLIVIGEQFQAAVLASSRSASRVLTKAS